VCKELFQCDDFFFRYEFAKARGQIQTHGLLFSETHAKKGEEAMDLTNSEENAKQLHEWLQINSQDTDSIFSPGFVSHPAGGKEKQNESGGVTWIPNKDGWARPEGNQEPPSFCNTKEDVCAFHTFLTNRVALYQCSGNCLQKLTPRRGIVECILVRKT